jgi:hypothetical protein
MIAHPHIHHELMILRRRELDRLAELHRTDPPRPTRPLPSLRAPLSRLAFRLYRIPAPARQAGGC